MITAIINTTVLPISSYIFKASCVTGFIYQLVSILQLSSFFMEAKNLFPITQYGFRRNLSCEKLLQNYVYYISKAMETSKQIDAVYFDLKAAFDLVNHELLIADLEKEEMPTFVTDFYKSFLSGRTQRVKFKDTYSRIEFVSLGTGQGTCSGPLLFTFFIRKLEKVLKFCKIFQYADDFVLIHEIRSQSDIENFQQDIDNVYKFITELLLEISVEKTVKMTFGENIFKSKYHVNNIMLTEVEDFKYLGVIFDSRLTFKKHLCLVNKNVWGTWLSLAKKYKHVPVFAKVRLFKSYIIPLIDYGISIYANSKSNIGKVEILQSKILRGIFHLPDKFIGYTEALKKSKTPKVQTRAVIYLLKQAYQVINNLAPPQLITHFVKSGSRYVILNSLRANTKFLRNTAIIRMPRLWSQIDNTTRTQHSTTTFLAELKKCAHSLSLFDSIYDN